MNKKPIICLAWMQGNQPIETTLRMVKSCEGLYDEICWQYNGKDYDYANKVTEELEKITNKVLSCTYPWKNFFENRNDVIKTIEDEFHSMNVDYILFMDADEELIQSENVFHEFELSEYFDSYEVEVDDQMSFSRRILFKTGMGYHYKGICHEFLDCENPTRIGKISSVKIKLEPKTNANHIYRNALLLKQGTETEKDPFLSGRYHFYLAQSYYDLGYYLPAIHHFQQRINREGWKEEMYFSYYMIGNCNYHLWLLNKMEHFFEEAQKNFVIARMYANRLEAPFQLMRLYMEKEDWPSAYEYLLSIYELKIFRTKPGNGLFVDNSIYDYLVYFWGALTFWHNHMPQLAMLYAEKVELAIGVPETISKQNHENMKFYGNI